MSKNFRQRFLEEAGEHPYAWVTSLGLPKDLVSSVMRGGEDYRPIQRTLRKLADATGRSVEWWLTGAEGGELGPARGSAQVAGTIAAGSAQVNPKLLALVVRAVDEWEQGRGEKISSERRSAVIAFLYDYTQKSSDKPEEALAFALQAMG